MALLQVLRRLPYSLVVGHVDHGLRKGSSKDATFVRLLAHQLDLPFKGVRVRVSLHAAQHKLGIEEAAREVRYRALLAMARSSGCRAVLTAHTSNDQAETVLMNFLRGAGTAGLAAMPEVRPLGEVLLVRPFLRINRLQIMSYLKANSLAYRVDPTNRSQRFMRNRIRRQTLPYLEKLYPGLRERLARMAVIFRDEESWWKDNVEKHLTRIVRRQGSRVIVALTPLFGYHRALSRRILRHVLPGLSFPEIERVVALAQSAKSNGVLQLSVGCRVVRRADHLILTGETKGSIRGIHE